MAQTTFDYFKYKDVVENAFTQRRILSAREKIIFNLAYKYHRLRTRVLIGGSFLYLWVFYPEVVRIQRKAREAGGLAYSSQWIRLAEIAHILRKFKPTSILECGSGASSAMLATLCPHRLTTIEESEYWKERLLKNIGPLAEQMNLVRAERIVEIRNGDLVDYYDIDHRQYYDMVYVDGPLGQTPPEFKNFERRDTFLPGHIPGIDVELLWQNNIYPRIIVIDSKRLIVGRLMETAKERYHIYLKTDFYLHCHIPYFSKYYYHTIMIRKF